MDAKQARSLTDSHQLEVVLRNVEIAALDGGSTLRFWFNTTEDTKKSLVDMGYKVEHDEFSTDWCLSW